MLYTDNQAQKYSDRTGHVYKIVRSHRKTLAIVVRNEQITVRAPLSLSDQAIHNFANSKFNWIEKKITEQKKKANEIYRIAAGEHIPIMGTLKLIKIESAMNNNVYLDQESITINGKNLTPIKSIQIFNAWLKAKASVELSARTRELSQKLGVFDKLKDITFRKTKTKWGHCTSQGRIQYNWQIFMAPENVINYVVTHEVCHLIYMNHSPHFWSLVEGIEPNYQQARVWLKDNGHKLML